MSVTLSAKMELTKKSFIFCERISQQLNYIRYQNNFMLACKIGNVINCSSYYKSRYERRKLMIPDEAMCVYTKTYLVTYTE